MTDRDVGGVQPRNSAKAHRHTARRACLYGLKHSHPVLASRMALELAGIPFEARDLFPGLHGIIVRLHRFSGWTVPALTIDGRRLQGTLSIAHALDSLAPEAGLFPRDAERRRRVEEAERFGHDELQPIARRVFRWAGAHDNAIRTWMAKYVIGTPLPTVAGYAFKPAMMFYSRVLSKASARQVRQDLARLPGLLDRADALVADGTIAEGPPNAADLQILTSIRLLLAHADLRPAIAPRPSGNAALRLIPDFPRSGCDALPPIPAALPPDWLSAFRAGSLAARDCPAPDARTAQHARA